MLQRGSLLPGAGLNPVGRVSRLTLLRGRQDGLCKGFDEVAQTSQSAVSRAFAALKWLGLRPRKRVSKPAGCRPIRRSQDSDGLPIGKSAIRQTGKSALLGCAAHPTTGVVNHCQGERAFTLFDLLAVSAIVALVVLVSLATFVRPRACCKAVRIQCVNNLKQVALGSSIWAGDNNNLYPAQRIGMPGSVSSADARQCFRYFQVMSNELGSPKVVICPADMRNAATNFNTGFSNLNVSFFVGLDANERNENMFLSGDRNLANGRANPVRLVLSGTNQTLSWTKGIHESGGNIAMTDGNVWQLTPLRLNQANAQDGGTNRLLMPVWP